MREKVVIAAVLGCGLLLVGLFALGVAGAVGVWESARADRLENDGWQAQAAGRLADAERLYAEALDLDEDDADAWAAYGYVLARQERHAAALVAYDRALAIDPDHEYATYCRGYALTALDRDDEALESIDQTLALGYEVGGMFVERARILLETGREDEADAAATSALGAEISTADEWNTLGNTLRSLGRPDDAANAYAHALELDAGHPWAGFNRGLVLGEAERYDEALADLDEAIARGHRVGAAHYERGRAYTELGRLDDALAEFELARSHGDEGARAWAETGDVLVLQGRDEEAVAAYRESLKVDPAFAESLRELGETLRRLGRDDEALAAFDGAVEHGAQPVDALIERGRFHLEVRDDVEAALADLERAAEIDPDSYYVHTNRGWIREKQEDWEGAFADYDAALAVRADESWTFASRGRMHLTLGRTEEAIADFTTAVRMAPEDCAHLLDDWRVASAELDDRDVTTPDLRLVQAELSVLRGRAFLRDVESATQKPEDFGERVGESIDAASTPQQRNGQVRGLRRLGLMERPKASGASGEESEEVDLRDAVAHALQTQAAAYYDPETDTFYYVAEGMPFEMLETVAAHELVHALQDQHEDLTEFLNRATRRPRGAPRNDDQVFAARSVAEGEATYVQMAWQMMRMRDLDPDAALEMCKLGVGVVSGMDTPRLLDMMRSFAAGLPDDSPMKASLAQADSIPSYVLVPFLGAYFKGAGLCNHQFTKDGWNGIDALYARPPESAEQVLHPLRYETRRDRPTPIALPDLDTVEAAGWERCDAAIHGEMYLALLLTENGVKPVTARRAAAGWDGDVYAAYAREDRTAIVLVSTWDSEKDAEEFGKAYVQALAGKRDAEGAVVEETRALDDGSLTRSVSVAPDDVVFVRVRGREVLVAEGWDDALGKQVLEQLERHPINPVE